MQKFFSKLVQAGSFCRAEEVHIHASEGKKNVYDRLKDLSLLQKATFRKVLQFASTSVVDTVYDIFGFQPLHDLHLGMSKFPKTCIFKFHGVEKIIKMAGGVV